MPSHDHIIQPSFPGFPGQPLVIVIPGAVIDAMGRKHAIERADALVRTIAKLASSPLAPDIPGLPRDLKSRIQNFLNWSQSSDISPSTYGDLFSEAGLPAPSHPRTRFPAKVSLVIYMTSDPDEVSGSTHVYRSGQLGQTRHSGVTLLRVNARVPLGFSREKNAYLLSSLYLAQRVAEGTYSPQAETTALSILAQSDTLFTAPQENDSVRATLDAGHLGFEQIFQGIQVLNREDHTPLADGVLAQTPAPDTPLFRLRVKNGQLQLEVVSRSLETFSYPEIHIARDLFIGLIRDLKTTVSPRGLVETYNQRLFRLLGPDGVPYRIKPIQDRPLGQIRIDPAPGQALEIHNQPIIRIPYAALGSDAFGNTLTSARAGHAFEKARQMAGKFIHSFERIMNKELSIISREPISPSFKAFAFQLFFEEFQLQAQGQAPNEQPDQDVAFYFSREDVLYSILSELEVKLLKAWFNAESSQTKLRGWLAENGLITDADPTAFNRIRYLLSHVAESRIETGRAQLGINPGRQNHYSPKPDDIGTTILHSGTFSTERRPITVDPDRQFHVDIGYLNPDSPMADLWDGLEAWEEGEGMQLYRQLDPHAYIPDSYARAAHEFDTSARALLQRAPDLDPAHLTRALKALISALPPTPVGLDTRGRIPQESLGWWGRVNTLGKQLKEVARGLSAPGLDQRIESGLRTALLANLEAPEATSRVSFENGAFQTWRGRVSPEELAIPPDWHPGDPLPGYTKADGNPIRITYVANEPITLLPEKFTMTWNGLAVPVDVLDGLPTDLPSQAVTFTDTRQGHPQVHTLTLPQGLTQLPGENAPLFTFEIEGIPNTLFLLDARDYVGSGSGLEKKAMANILFLKRLGLILTRTQTGRGINTRLARRPGINARQLGEDLRIQGLPPGEVLGDGSYALLARLGPSSTQFSRLTPEGLESRGEEAGTPGFIEFSRALGSIAYDVNAIPVPPDQDAAAFRREFILDIENNLREEMGRGLRARTAITDTDIAVPLDGSVLALDENNTPISLVRLWEETVLNRYFDLFRQGAQRIIPDITIEGLAHPSPAIRQAMARIKVGAGSDPSAETRGLIQELYGLQRQILNHLRNRTRTKDLEMNDAFRMAPSEPLYSSEELSRIAATRWSTWLTRMEAALADRTLTPRVENFILNEIQEAKESRRSVTDFTLWMDRLSPRQKAFALIRMQVVLEDTQNSVLKAALTPYALALSSLENEVSKLRKTLDQSPSLPEPYRAATGLETATESGSGRKTPPQGKASDIKFVRFRQGVQVDRFDLPVLPGSSEALSDKEMRRVRRAFGDEFTGQIQISPRELKQVDASFVPPDPSDATMEQPLTSAQESDGPSPLELPRDHIREQVRQRALDAVDMEAVLRRLPARVRDHGMTRQAVETMAEGAADAVNLQLEAQRDHMRLMKAVVDRIRTQNEETGGDWVLAPDSIDTDGDTLHFKVVRRSDVLSGGTAEQPEPLVRPGAESVRLGINIHGIIKTPGLLAARNRLAAKWLEKMRSVDPEGRLQAGIGGITFAGGLMLAGIGLLQAVRGLEEREDWQSVYGAASASYFAGHAAVGGLSKALSTQLGKRLVSGAQRLVTTATEAAVEGVARVTGRTAAEVGESLAKITTVAARSATTLAGVVGEIIPFVGVAVGLVMIGLDAYHLFEAKNDIERVQYGVDMVFDAAVTIIDLVGSAFPPAEIVTAPLSLVINVVRMIFDSAMVEVQAELAKLPADATDAQKALAVINGIGFGFRDFLRNLTPWAAVEDAKAIDKEHNQDLDYIHSLNDPATYFGIHPVTGVTGEAALDFQMGDNSMSGGDVVVRLGEPGANTRITIGDVPQDRLNNGEGELATHSLDWQGVLAANTDFVLLGFGESYTIQTTVAKAYLFWAIPVHSQTVISGTGANRDSRTGTYFGNSRDNTFVGPRRSDLADAPGDTQEVRDRKSDLRTALSTYHYYIHGGEGNDTFTVGGSVNHLYGDEGADTYIIQEQGYFYIHNQAADTALDTLVLDNTLLFQLGIEINPGRFSEGRNTLGINTTYYSDDTSSRYQLRETTLGQVVDFLESEAHRHLRIRTRDGYLIHLNGDRLAAQRDAGNYHYVLQSDDIRGIFVNGQQSPNFDARINGASVFHSGSIQPQRQGNRVEYTPGRFHNIRLNHIENIFGDDRYNSLGGNQLDNYIHGGGGNDFIYGYDGNDTLVGGAAGHGGPNIVQSILSGGRGKDTLISSPESSQLFGGQGADTYILDRGITQVLIRDVSDGELNLVQLPVVARHLVQTLAADGDLLLTDSAHPARQVRVDNWRDSDALFEFHTADGWIYTRTGSNLGLTGFDGMTFAPAKADAALLSLPPSNCGFDLTVYDLPRGADRPTTPAQVDRVVRSGHRVASGHLSSLDFAGGGTPPLVNQFLNQPNLTTGSRTVTSAGLLKFTTHIWLDQGRHEFRLTSSMNSFLRINGGTVIGMGAGTVHQGGNTLAKNGHITVETPGFFTLEVFYSGQGTDDTAADGDNEHRDSSLPEHYFRLEKENGQGEFHVLGTGDTDTLVRNLADLPNAHLRGDQGLVFDATRSEYAAIERIIGSNDDDLLSGNALDNQIFGSGGSDTMTGWNGSDVYHVDGQGLDIIRNIAGDGLMDNVYLPGTRANLTFAIVDNRHLEVRSSGTPIARVEDWALSEAHRHIQFHTREGIILGVAPATSDDGDITVQTFVAAMDFGQRETGVTFNAGSDTDFPQLHSIMGSEFDDTLTGNDQDNQISAEKGNNHLRGMGGNDILYAGTGSDILEGGEGRDSYVVTLASHTVTLRNAQAGEEQNILRLHADKGQIRLSREGDDLIIQGARFGQGTVRVVVEDWYIDPSVRNLAVATDDDWFFTIDGDPPTIQNKELNFATETRGQVIDLTRSGIYGTDTARVNGSPFADTIMGNALDNLIIGGGGADHLTGGAGADVYVVGANAGEVTIDNRTRDNARDVILLSMAADRIDRTQASGDDLLIRTHAGTTLRLLGWQTQAQARDITLMVEGQSFSLDPAGRFVLESVDFSGQDAGIIHTLRQGATALSGSPATDELTGNPGDNHLTGGLGGMDRLTGLDGSDIYDVHLPVNTAGDQALTPTEVEAPGGRIITIANGARDNAMDRILARDWTREQVRTRRHGNDLLLYAVDGPGDLTGAALPRYGIRVENWFIDASAHHLALELPNEGTVIQITDAGNLGPIIGIDDSAMTTGQTRDLTTPSHGSVLRITDSDFDDTYTGNSADDLFISRGGNDRLVGGNGQDTFSISGIFSRTPRTITLRNGGDDGETDLVFLDMAAADLYFSRIRPDGFLEIQGAGLTLVLEDWDAGSADHPAFQLATREGITFGMDAHGRLSIVSVDISHGSAQTIDATAVFNPTREDARVVARNGAGALAVPGQLAQALILKGSPGSDRLLAGDGDNTLVSGGTGTEVEILSGGGGKDNYVLAAQGRYEIQNHDESKAMDTVQLDLNFNHIQGLRNQNDLELTSSFGFSLTIAGYFTSDAFRHLSFVTRDGIQFEISGPDLEVEDRTLVFKTIRGMDLSNATEDVTVDLGRVGTFTHARMGVTGFTGSKTFANQVTGGPLGTQVTTGGARDTITTQDGNDLIRSGGGDDRVTAGGGKDILFAGDGNDSLDGGAGDDVIVGNAGSDTINGGEGSDTLAFVGDALTQTGVNVNLALGRGEDADAQGDRYTNVENITATPFDDTLEGDEGINVLQAGDGDDALLGNGGTDILAPGAGTDRVDGGEGSDTVDYADLFLGIHVDLVQGTAFHLDGDYAPTGITDTLVSIENVRGTAFDDRILGNSEDNLVLGSMGRDRLDLGGGHDLVDYTDLVFAGDQGLWIDLGVQANWDLDALPQAQDQGYQVQWLAHVEEIHGSTSGDRIYGTDGNETLDGGAGIDELRGRGGDDLFLGRNDGDRIHGGDGNDTLDYSRLLAGITASLTTGRAGQDQLSHIENLSGSQFNDILEGDDNINRLSGSLGLDELSGLGGNDLFFGPGDGDLFMGGEGTDTVDFRNAAHGVSVTMGRTDFTEQERAAWEALTLRTDHLIGVEIVHGSAFSDLLSGSALSGETLHGGGGNDWFTGSLQGETLDQGRSPNPETLSPPPTPLRDTLNGGEGLDVVSYAQAQAGIYAHLGRGLAGGDRLVSIEGIEGSAFDDILLGSGADDLFFAGAGNDVIGGGEGNDTLDHRLLDTVDGITVTALAPDTDPTMSPDTAQDQILNPDGSSDPIPNSDQNNGPDQDAPQNQGLPHTYQSRFTDTTGTSHETRILDVETLMGTGHDDVFTGGNLADHFMGLGGDDIFTGGLGNDRLEGGDGDDTYTYTNGDGSDTLRDTAGNDQIQFSGLGRSDLAFWANGDDLLIGIGQETLTIEDGLSQAGAVETIALADGSTLTATATRQLVEAMAQFATDNGLEIQSVQDAAQNNALTSLAATAWQGMGSA